MNKVLKRKTNDVLPINSEKIFRDLFNKATIDTMEWIIMQVLGCDYEHIHGKVVVKEINMPVAVLMDIIGCKEQIIMIFNKYSDSYMNGLLYSLKTVIANYSNMATYRKVILINLNWFNQVNLPLREEYEFPQSLINISDGLLRVVDINLNKYSELNYHEIDYNDRLWKLLTIKNKQELDMITRNERLLKNYYHKLITLSNDDEYRRGLN